ncbi:MAG: hypothetical protein ACYTGZ_08310 [Planctomycetota bacterium]|jgi:hypothetical protein
MDVAALYGASVAAFVVSGFFYFKGWFRLATLAGLLFWPLVAQVMQATMAPGWAIPIFFLFGVVPAMLMLLHAYDVPRGVLNLPTFYAIPVAYLGGLLLLFCSALGVIF